MSGLERIRAAKREFDNKINYVDYNEYDSNALMGVKYRIVGINFEDDKATKVQKMMETLIDSLDDIPSPNSEEKWDSVVQSLSSSRGVVEPNEKPYNSSEQAATVARVWNGILGLQYHIEEEKPIKE